MSQVQGLTQPQGPYQNIQCNWLVTWVNFRVSPSLPIPKLTPYIQFVKSGQKIWAAPPPPLDKIQKNSFFFGKPSLRREGNERWRGEEGKLLRTGRTDGRTSKALREVLTDLKRQFGCKECLDGVLHWAESVVYFAWIRGTCIMYKQFKQCNQCTSSLDLRGTSSISDDFFLFALLEHKIFGGGKNVVPK